MGSLASSRPTGTWNAGSVSDDRRTAPTEVGQIFFDRLSGQRAAFRVSLVSGPRPGSTEIRVERREGEPWRVLSKGGPTGALESIDFASVDYGHLY